MSATEMRAAEPMTISLWVNNRYERHDDEVRIYTDLVIPAPPVLDERDKGYRAWSAAYIADLTGVGHTDGKSWYDVKVTACSVPEMVGRTFEFEDN